MLLFKKNILIKGYQLDSSLCVMRTCLPNTHIVLINGSKVYLLSWNLSDSSFILGMEGTIIVGASRRCIAGSGEGLKKCE